MKNDSRIRYVGRWNSPFFVTPSGKVGSMHHPQMRAGIRKIVQRILSDVYSWQWHNNICDGDIRELVIPALNDKYRNYLESDTYELDEDEVRIRKVLLEVLLDNEIDKVLLDEDK